ncbi:MAG: hypothetical protein ACREA8_07545 [Nitrosotalea sp.]
MTDVPFTSRTLEEILQKSLFSTPAVSIRIEDTLVDAASLLSHHLETLTDSLVAINNVETDYYIGRKYVACKLG